MGVYQKNGRWRFEVMINGQRYHRGIPEATCEKDANKYLTIFKADLLRGKLDLAESIGRKPFSLIADNYIEYANNNLASKGSTIGMAERFKSLWKNKRISEITPELIEKYKKIRLNTVYHTKTTKDGEIEKKISPATINRELGVLSKIFSIAIENKYAKENPVEHVSKLKVPNKLERHLTPEEEDRIIKVCDGDYSFMDISVLEQEELKKKYKDYHKYLKPIILMAILTAMRKSEILNMKWDCVDFKNRTITIVDTKNGSMHTIPLSQRFYDILSEMKSKNPDNIYIFTNPDTNTRYKCFYRGFTSVLRLADVKNFTFHDTRHTSATRMVAKNIPIPVVQSILNHKKIQTTMRYAHTMQEQQAIALEALSKYGQED